MGYKAVVVMAMMAFVVTSGGTVGAAIPTGGLVGYWKGDGNANDSSATGNNGVFSGAYAPGISGGAFNLATGIVSIPDVPAYSMGWDVSVGFWFNGTVGPNGSCSFLGQDEGSGDFTKWIVDYNYLQAGGFDLIMDSAGKNTLLSSPGNLALSSGWNHFTFVKSGSNVDFYLNGASIGTRVWPGYSDVGAFPDPAAALTLGYTEPGLGYSGLVADVTIYDRALSSLEVSDLASVPEPASVALLVLGGASVLARRRRLE